MAAVALVTVTAVAASAAAAPRAEDSAVPAYAGSVGRPNVLLIVTDDQRNGLEIMPSLKKRIRRRGTKFPNAYATTPLCCPSRSSIFTGKYSHNHEVVDNGSAGSLDPKTTVQYFLHEAGYRTGLVGKYLNSVRRNGPPVFKQSAVLLSKRSSKYYYGGRWSINGRRVVRPKIYATSFIEKHALDILDRWNNHKDDKPWFLLVAPTAPHKPFTTLPEYEKLPVSNFQPTLEEDRSDKPLYVQNSFILPEEGINQRAAQYRALMPVDTMIENLTLSMDELEEKSDTIVIYMSDNALMWAEHGLGKKTVP
ncbi:MAG TPA: sulfatase-like hydrolase/transferase, partial [Actinomycetota bacterium]|nr:sulfatase-like hydrolase/transferase [Actinomycetota bacterium]